MKMPFGKYKGEDIEDIPEEYLYWLLTEVELQEPLRTAVYRVYYGINPTEDLKEPIKQVIAFAYRKITKKWHPDVGVSNEAMQAINDFYGEIKEEIDNFEMPKGRER